MLIRIVVRGVRGVATTFLAPATCVVLCSVLHRQYLMWCLEKSRTMSLFWRPRKCSLEDICNLLKTAQLAHGEEHMLTSVSESKTVLNNTSYSEHPLCCQSSAPLCQPQLLLTGGMYRVSTSYFHWLFLALNNSFFKILVQIKVSFLWSAVVLWINTTSQPTWHHGTLLWPLCITFKQWFLHSIFFFLLCHSSIS